MSSKVAIVTGAGSGIGKHTTLAFLSAGYSVALAGRREDPLKATVLAIQRLWKIFLRGQKRNLDAWMCFSTMRV